MKIAICVPCGDMLHMDFVMSLLAMQSALHTNPVVEDQDINIFFQRSSILIKSRHDLAVNALDWGADWILWLDSDMAFPADTLHKLLHNKEDIVGANYVSRAVPTVPTAVDSERRYIRTDPDSTGLQAAEWVGFGCLLTKADIFRNLPFPWFDFVWINEGKDIFGEDVFFFQKAKHFLKKQLYIDHDLSQMVRHVGVFEYHNRLALATVEDYKARGEVLANIEKVRHF